jgi:hypothetical protein
MPVFNGKAVLEQAVYSNLTLYIKFQTDQRNKRNYLIFNTNHEIRNFVSLKFNEKIE